MTAVSSARRPLLLAIVPAIVLGTSLALPPRAGLAQTPDSAAGTGPSRAVSIPPNTDPINQPGAMRRAYTHRSTKTTARHRAAPQPQANTAPH